MSTEAGLRHKSRIYIRTHRALHGAGTRNAAQLQGVLELASGCMGTQGPFNLRAPGATPLPSLDWLHSSRGEQPGFLHFPAYRAYHGQVRS